MPFFQDSEETTSLGLAPRPRTAIASDARGSFSGTGAARGPAPDGLRHPLPEWEGDDPRRRSSGLPRNQPCRAFRRQPLSSPESAMGAEVTDAEKDARNSIPLLIHGLGHADMMERYWAAHCPGVRGPDSRCATDRPIQALDDPSPMGSGEAARTLGRIGSGAARALPGIIELMRRTDAIGDAMKSAAHLAFGGMFPTIGEQTRLATALLADARGDPMAETRYAAASGLRPLAELEEIVQPVPLKSSTHSTTDRATSVTGPRPHSARSLR